MWLYLILCILALMWYICTISNSGNPTPTFQLKRILLVPLSGAVSLSGMKC